MQEKTGTRIVFGRDLFELGNAINKFAGEYGYVEEPHLYVGVWSAVVHTTNGGSIARALTGSTPLEALIEADKYIGGRVAGVGEVLIGSTGKGCLVVVHIYPDATDFITPSDTSGDLNTPDATDCIPEDTSSNPSDISKKVSKSSAKKGTSLDKEEAISPSKGERSCTQIQDQIKPSGMPSTGAHKVVTEDTGIPQGGITQK